LIILYQEFLSLSSLFLFFKKIFILPQEYYKTVEDENQKIKYSGGTGMPVPLATAKSRPRLLGKSYGDFSVAFFTIGRNSTSCGR